MKDVEVLVPKFNIGDKVWLANCDRKAQKIICEDCFGSKYLTVIMGNGEKVTIECRGCWPGGFESATGYNTVYNYEANSEQAFVNRIEISKDSNGEKYIEYYTDKGCGRDRVFATKEEADEKAKEIWRDYRAEEIQRLKHKYKDHKTWSWNACYHRREIKRAKEQIEYHSNKLDYASQVLAERERKETK